jgi:hypothetical protein
MRKSTALSTQNCLLPPSRIPDWFSTLTGEPLEEVKKVWQEGGYKSLPESTNT